MSGPLPSHRHSLTTRFHRLRTVFSATSTSTSRHSHHSHDSLLFPLSSNDAPYSPHQWLQFLDDPFFSVRRTDGLPPGYLFIPAGSPRSVATADISVSSAESISDILSADYPISDDVPNPSSNPEKPPHRSMQNFNTLQFPTSPTTPTRRHIAIDDDHDHEDPLVYHMDIHSHRASHPLRLSQRLSRRISRLLSPSPVSPTGMREEGRRRRRRLQPWMSSSLPRASSGPRNRPPYNSANVSENIFSENVPMNADRQHTTHSTARTWRMLRGWRASNGTGHVDPTFEMDATERRDGRWRAFAQRMRRRRGGDV